MTAGYTINRTAPLYSASLPPLHDKKKYDRMGSSCNDCPYKSSVCNDVNKRSSHFHDCARNLVIVKWFIPWEVTLRSEQATASQSE